MLWIGRDRKLACLVPDWAGKHAKWLHKLMSKGETSVIVICCMDTDKKDEGCVNVVQCDGMMTLRTDGGHLMCLDWT